METGFSYLEMIYLAQVGYMNAWIVNYGATAAAGTAIIVVTIKLWNEHTYETALY